MTVPVQTTFTASVANGATTVFPYGFLIASADDLAVTLDGVLQTSGYTVSGVGNPAGGNVTFSSAPDDGTKVLRYLSPEMTRSTDYQQFGDWQSDIVNLDFDRLWLALQYVQQSLKRSLKLPVDTAEDQVVTQDAAERANKIFAFDSEGNLTVVSATDLDVTTLSVYALELLSAIDAEEARLILEIPDPLESASQAEMEAGTESALRGMSPLRVAQAIAALSAADSVTISLLMLEVADLQNQAQVMGPTGNRFADSFDALTYVDTAGATNLDTGTAGKLKPTVATATDQTGSGTAISGGSHADGPSPSSAFDNNTGTRWSSSQSTTGVSGVAYIGYDFGAGVTKDIRQVTLLQGWSGAGVDATSYSIASLKVQYSDNGSSWNDAYTWAVGQTSYNAGVQTSPVFASVGAHRYWRLLANANPSTNYWNVHEAEMLNAAATNNLTVASTALTAAAAPSAMTALVRVDYVDTPTLNTDLMLDVSRDGGTTWATATLSLAYTAPGSVKVLTTNSVSVSSQPSGTSPKWRIRTANNKMVHIRDVYLYWS